MARYVKVGIEHAESDYRDVARTKRAVLERLKPHWQDSLILFLGYGAGDDDLKAQAHAVREVFGDAYAPSHLAIDLSGQTNEALLRVQWSPLQADVLIGRDLPGDTAGERLLELLRASAEAIADLRCLGVENSQRWGCSRRPMACAGIASRSASGSIAPAEELVGHAATDPLQPRAAGRCGREATVVATHVTVGGWGALQRPFPLFARAPANAQGTQHRAAVHTSRRRRFRPATGPVSATAVSACP